MMFDGMRKFREALFSESPLSELEQVFYIWDKYLHLGPFVSRKTSSQFLELERFFWSEK
jgi:hypothetical protein